MGKHLKPSLLRYSLSVARKDLLIAAGRRIGRCLNTPYLIYYSITNRCNAACITCLRWQSETGAEELTPPENISLMNQIRRWAGPCRISFTGGEPLVREDIEDVLRHCAAIGLGTTLNTNGILLDEKGRGRIAETGVDSIIFSLNSISAQLHDRYKGVPGLHQRITETIQYLCHLPSRPRLGIILLVTKDTYRSLAETVRWAQTLGIDTIDVQPILDIHPKEPTPRSPLCGNEFLHDLYRIDDLAELDKQINLLVNLKQNGVPLITPRRDLEAIKLFFRSPALLIPRRGCSIGFRNLYIAHDGSVQLCPWFPPIGNIRLASLNIIWSSPAAQNQRKELLSCRQPCLAGCMRPYSLAEKVQHFFLINR